MPKNEAATLNIYQKLAKIRKPVEVIQKNKRGYGYSYVTEDEILAKITGLMGTLGVSLVPNIVPGTSVIEPYHYTKSKAAKDGTPYEEHVNEILVRGEMEWIWVNNDNPEDRIVVPWMFVGSQADASQSFGSALTYASRYFLLKYFNVATSDDDPDNWRSKQREAEDEEEKLVAQKIVEKIHDLVTAHLSEHPDDRQKIADITKKYARDEKGKATGNYFAIDKSATAAQLLEALNAVWGEAK